MEKKALGKGLGALLPSSKLSQPTEPTDVQRIRIETIVPNRYQPRHTFPQTNSLNLRVHQGERSASADYGPPQGGRHL